MNISIKIPPITDDINVIISRAEDVTWFTFVCDDKGNIPPQDQWKRHDYKFVTVELDAFKRIIGLSDKP